MTRLFPALALLIPLAACGRTLRAPPKDRTAVPTAKVAPASASVSPQVPVSALTGDARVVADLERVASECQTEPCPAGSAWIKAAPGHERALMTILERDIASEHDENAQLLAAAAILKAQERHQLPDDIGRRVVALAAARQPSEKLLNLFCHLVVSIDAEHLGLTDDLRKLAIRWPDTPFQIRFAEILRSPFPASAIRVEILRSYLAHGSVNLETSAIDGLAQNAATLSAETCEALAYGRRTALPEAAVYAALRIAAAPCGDEREPALADLEERIKVGPLPGIPAELQVRLSYLCAIDRPYPEQLRSVATLGAIALSRRQNLPIREEAMSSVRTCAAGDWKTLRSKLLTDPNPKVHAAVSNVDSLIIDW